jgi:hypothetical protein
MLSVGAFSASSIDASADFSDVRSIDDGCETLSDASLAAVFDSLGAATMSFLASLFGVLKSSLLSFCFVDSGRCS